MINNISFKKFDHGEDLEAQRKLFKECFPENNGTAAATTDHYLWKFHSYPSSPESYEYSANENSDIIGYYAALPYEYLLFGKKVTVGMVCDVMTGERSRGKGVFTRLGKYATEQMKNEGLAFTTGYPIRPEVIPGHLKAGWEIMFDLPMFIRILKTDEILDQYKLKILAPVINILIISYNAIVDIVSKPYSGFSTEYYSSKDLVSIAGLKLFLDQWCKINNISLNKTIDFLLWRLGAPEREYNIVCLRKKNELVGLAITRKIIKNGIPSLAILDFMVLREARKYVASLHSAVYKLGVKQSASAIIMMLNNFKRKKFRLFRNGFMKSPYKFTLIVKKLAAIINMDELRKDHNWHLTWLDSDDL